MEGFTHIQNGACLAKIMWPCLQCIAKKSAHCFTPLKHYIKWHCLKWLVKHLFYFNFYPLFHGIQLLVATILSHRYNSCTGSGETKVESHASSETQPNQTVLLLNTAHIQPGSQPHQCVGGNTVHLATLVSAHCARPATGVAGAR